MLRINDVKTVGQAVNLLNQISQIDLGNEKNNLCLQSMGKILYQLWK